MPRKNIKDATPALNASYGRPGTRYLCYGFV